MKKNDKQNKIPEGFVKCPVCGEYKGETRAKYLNWSQNSFIEPNKIISSSCRCSWIICPKCNVNKIPKPVSNQYDQLTNSIWHIPWFAGQAGCDNCRNKK